MPSYKVAGISRNIKLSTHLSRGAMVLFCSLAFSMSAQAETYTCYDSPCIKLRLENAQPGDQILIAPGDYFGIKARTTYNFAGYFYTNKSGTKDDPITLEALDPNNKPVLHGKNTSDAYVFHIYGVSHWNIRNIIFHSASKGLVLDNVQNSLLDGLEVYNIGDEAVHFRDGSSNNVIRNSKIHDTGLKSPGYGEGVYIGSADGTTKPDGSAYNQAANNNRVSNVVFGPNVRADLVDIKEKTSGAIVEDCVFNATGMLDKNSTDSVINIKGNNAIIRNNIINREGNPNVKFAFKIYAVPSSGELSGRNNQFINNTLNLDTSEPFVISIQSRMIAFVQNNKRIPDGNLYTGTGSAKEIDGPIPTPSPSVSPTSSPSPKPSVIPSPSPSPSTQPSPSPTPTYSPPVSGSTITLVPTDDSWVRDGSKADKNYGTDKILQIKSDGSGGRVAYLKFDLKQASPIVKAKLRLYAQLGYGTTLNVYASDNNWSQDTLTWNNRPLIGAALGSVSVAGPSVFQYYEFDLTDALRSLDAENAIISFALRETKEKYTEVYSSENAVNAPELVIETAK